MKICMFGLGSIGKRHIRNIALVLNERKITFEIDAFRTQNTPLPQEIKKILHKEYYNLEELPDDYDVIFITNPTFLHFETIQQNVKKTKHMFIEKPIFHHAKYRIGELELKSVSIYYVACPMRYKSSIQYIKGVIDQGEIFAAARVICSSYLPEWRPSVDYRSIYSGKKDMGGGVILDLIHEWDYFMYLFGAPLELYHFSGKYSQLEIDSDDLAVYIARYERMLVQIHLDYLGRKQERKLELFGTERRIDVDLLREQIVIYSGNKEEVVKFSEEDCYKKEMDYFFNCIDGKEKNTNDIYHAMDVLRVVM